MTLSPIQWIQFAFKQRQYFNIFELCRKIWKIKLMMQPIRIYAISTTLEDLAAIRYIIYTVVSFMAT